MDVADNIAVLNEGRDRAGRHAAGALRAAGERLRDVVPRAGGAAAGPARAAARPARLAASRATAPCPRRWDASPISASRCAWSSTREGQGRVSAQTTREEAQRLGLRAGERVFLRADEPSLAASGVRARKRGGRSAHGGPALDLPRGDVRAVVARRPRRDRPRAGAHARVASARSTASRTRARGEQAARQADAEPGPVDPRRVLRHVAARRADHDGAARCTAPGRACRARRGDTTTSQRGHRLRVGQPRHEPRVAAAAATRPGGAPVRAREHPHRRAAEARERRPQERAPPGPATSRARRRTTGPSPGGGVGGRARRLPQQRADHAQPGRPAARVLEVRQRRPRA